MMSRQIRKQAFTLIELLVVIAIIGILAAMLLPALNKARQKGYQAACIANIKQWGVAISLYADEHSGWYYYNSTGGANWDDVGGNANPYAAYLIGKSGNLSARIRTMRICPARRGHPEVVANAHSYSMPIGWYQSGSTMVEANQPGTPFEVNNTYYPRLIGLPKPAQYIVIIESTGHSVTCGGLVSITTKPSSGDADMLPPIQRHVALISTLFGDFHAESLTLPQLQQIDGINCSKAPGNPYFLLQ
ncbi:MAG TPA: type II secretion system protein [Verrucomicrobiae bacterium]|nr:type II secretion system protein [Verrucomicrobiae bacterium]